MIDLEGMRVRITVNAMKEPTRDEVCVLAILEPGQDIVVGYKLCNIEEVNVLINALRKAKETVQ